MSFRPSPVERIRSTWTRRRPQQRTVQRAATVVCLTLGLVGGLNALTSACTENTAITSEQLSAIVNRSTVVQGFADAFINVYLSGGGTYHSSSRSTALALTAFTSAQIEPPAKPVSVIKTAPWSAQPLNSNFANVDYWSVVIGAFVKPIAKAPQLWFYQVPVAVVSGAPRITSAPAFINGPPPGYDADLSYPADVPATSDAYQTASGFLTSWLTGAGDISRYSISPAITPFSPPPFSSVTINKMDSADEIPTPAPDDGFTTQILITATAVQDGAEQKLTYPLSVTYRSNKWFITDIDLAPKLAGRMNEPPTPTTATEMTTTTAPPR